MLALTTVHGFTAAEQTNVSHVQTQSSDIEKAPLSQLITTAATIPSTTIQSPATTQRIPSDLEIEQAKKLIQEVATSMKDNPLRLAVNKPATPSRLPSTPAASVSFPPDSIESLVSDSTTRFGLNLLKTINEQAEKPTGKNVVLSPLSMQNLLSMLLLGSGGASELELAQVLGYLDSGLMRKSPEVSGSDASANNKSNLLDESTRMKPHEALQRVLENIMKATHFPMDNPNASNLLNSNLDDLARKNDSAGKQEPVTSLAAHLQTNERDSSQALRAQVNFTLANLLLTNKELVELDENYELDLKHFYDVQLEQFESPHRRNNTETGANSTSLAEAPKNMTKSESRKLEQEKRPIHERVNEWVKKMTQNQIEQLVQASDFQQDGQLAMILLNAAHFKGRWLHTFSQKATQQQVFYSGPDGSDEEEVPFMRQKGEFGYAEFGQFTAGQQGAHPGSKVSAEDAETLLTEDNEQTTKMPHEQQLNAAQQGDQQSSKEQTRALVQSLNCTALALPFSPNDGQELQMVFVLPNKQNGLAELMAQLDQPMLNEIYKQLHEQQQQVQVEIPKFSFESKYEVKELLQKLGLKSVFQQLRANFTRMLAKSSGREVVDKVVHKAKIMIDENGAEAAAASLVSINSRNFVRQAPTFKANHPFLFIIRHSRSNMPLFMGQVSSVSSA